MKILNPEQNGETSISPDEIATTTTETTTGAQTDAEAMVTKFDNDLHSAIAEAQSEIIAETTPDDSELDDGIGTEADIAENTKSDPLLEVAEKDLTSSQFNNIDNDKYDVNEAIAQIEQSHKDAFIDSVITGERYIEEFSLFNGRFKLKVRARSVLETDAITAYARRMISINKVKVDYEYSALMRKLLVLTQVEELNGVKNPVLEGPLFFEETATEMKPPAWESRLITWGNKPEVVIIAITKCILEFEARYWHMIQHVNDENFWLPGESTGE